MSKTVPGRILPIIVFAQFAGTSLWFAGNAVINQLRIRWELPDGSLASITSAVQLGFIAGTFLFALTSMADRFRPSRVFFFCALLGGLLNVSTVFLPPSYELLLVIRFSTGFFLAGIYPVGMKIASDWFSGKLGKALGYLVGALVLGTAFPHLLNHLGHSASWQSVLTGTSIIAISGGLAMLLFVGDGPHRTTGAKFSPSQFIRVFKNKEFRSAAFGYFGHMWELYTFWAFVPIMLRYYNVFQQDLIYVSLWSFIIIASGAIASAIGGVFSIRFGSAKTAFWFLLVSGLCCLASPLFFQLPSYVFLSMMIIWGLAVVGDSAQFSSLNAKTAPPKLVGTALTIAISIGFLITIPSIQLISFLDGSQELRWILPVLAIGPLFGLVHTTKLIRARQ